MPRQPRIQFKGAVYHVMARGNRRGPIFVDDEDHEMFLRTLGEACEKAEFQVYAWVLMGNHYHLAFSTPRGNLVEGMKWFQNTYTRRFNCRHKQCKKDLSHQLLTMPPYPSHSLSCLVNHVFSSKVPSIMS